MANFVLQVPSRLRTFPVFSSSNGASPSASGTGGVGAGGPVILELPLERIRRPLMRTRANDPNKVKELMDSISEIGLQVPASLAATASRLTSALDSLPSGAKFAGVQRRL
ncbi:sulfiredoxin, chloroplastic/mitochondrial isoform X3 [Prosopis cineraria]|uniref:sulfiredoxin, chloroplastic/mitochondrial isoform X3 n=1 Tax=Prosopis cineraria TaxID=364024 RepID=UPI00240F7FBE|nr:sulfiredoxin, chloroplastic/mitochondrial isoform X3 [Prosopis cineraria]